jgi:hypothetical protein
MTNYTDFVKLHATKHKMTFMEARTDVGLFKSKKEPTAEPIV